ncbi:MAG TPA: hypothetical protein VEQ65_14380 [Opitutus sp.]|nr:hypothetical protein [Opitutus sp.]
MSSPKEDEEAPWRAGLRSARANLLPGFVLQLAAVALVVAYYRHEPTRAVLTKLADFRTEVGVPFAILSTGFFGGLLPVLYLRARRATRGHYSAAQGAALTLFWAYKGFEVDLLYRLLARYVGEGHDVATIATKTVFDQFIYCPTIAVPVTVLLYEWVATRFDHGAVASDVRRGGWIRRRVIPVLISNLAVWLPAVCIIYSLPTPLQLPLQNLVLCFFTLLVAHQTRRTL